MRTRSECKNCAGCSAGANRTLDQAYIGETVTVCGVLGCGGIRRRILDMGLTKGTKVFVRKSAPFGDPIQISLRGFELTMRKQDAKIVRIV